MNSIELLKRITTHPDICHGKPCIRGLRHTVSSVLEYLAGGDSTEEIISEFPDLSEEDIQACLAFAVLAVNSKGSIVIPTAA